MSHARNENKTIELESNARDFCDRTGALKNKFEKEAETGEKKGFLSSKLFLKLRPSKQQQVLHPESDPAEKETIEFVAKVPKKFLTTQQRIDLLEVNLKKYKKTHPTIYAAGYKVVTEAYDLYNTKISLVEKTNLNQSLDTVIALIRDPNQQTYDAVRTQASVALGHENKFKHYTGAILAFIGLVTLIVCLFVAPPVSLVGFGLFVGGGYLYKQSEEKSLAKTLNHVADKSQVLGYK